MTPAGRMIRRINATLNRLARADGIPVAPASAALARGQEDDIEALAALAARCARDQAERARLERVAALRAELAEAVRLSRPAIGSAIQHSAEECHAARERILDLEIALLAAGESL